MDASLRSMVPVSEDWMRVVNFLVRRPREESYRDRLAKEGVLPVVFVGSERGVGRLEGKLGVDAG
jgi:hypothetical protein